MNYLTSLSQSPNIADVVGFGASIDYLNRIGMSAVRTHEIDLVMIHYGKDEGYRRYNNLRSVATLGSGGVMLLI